MAAGHAGAIAGMGDQRFAMYSVISNPKRKSVKEGLLQAIFVSLNG
jgi:hypothetical protein